MSQQTKNKNKTMISHPTHNIVPQHTSIYIYKKNVVKNKKTSEQCERTRSKQRHKQKHTWATSCKF